jgi:hypothetical protein
MASTAHNTPSRAMLRFDDFPFLVAYSAVQHSSQDRNLHLEGVSIVCMRTKEKINKTEMKTNISRAL